MVSRPKLGGPRLLTSVQSVVLALKVMMADLNQDLLCHRLGMYYNLNLLDHIPKTDGFYPLYVKEEEQCFLSIFPQGKLVHEGMADFLGASYMIVPDNPLEWQARTNWMPMITGGQRPVFVEETHTLATILGEKFNPRTMVVLSSRDRAQIQSDGSSLVNLTNVIVTPNAIQLDAQCSQKSMVVVAQTYYHCWKAYVDGLETPLYRANHAYQALEVPSGQHHIELRYVDNTFRMGLGISLAALFICVGGIWRRMRL
jgi:hypothetical protein